MTVRSLLVLLVGMFALVSHAEVQASNKGEPLISPTEARERDFYAPNSETLKPDEMRVIACGTGMPQPRLKQAAACMLVELGNGDKFIFDMGLGSMGNLFSLRPDFSKLDKVFVSHLHIDHVGDFMGLHIGGWLSGRYSPIHIYGPSGSAPELGTKAFVEGIGINALVSAEPGRPNGGGVFHDTAIWMRPV